jgi:hypothetical protein
MGIASRFAIICHRYVIAVITLDAYQCRSSDGSLKVSFDIIMPFNGMFDHTCQVELSRVTAS